MSKNGIFFGKILIPDSQIFIKRNYCYGMINHKPFIDGHVLICSKREVSKIQDLNEDEIK